MTFELRPEQTDLYQRVREAIGRGKKRVLVQLPTGGGKTVIASKMISTSTGRGYRAWFNVHRRELVKQSVRTLTNAAGLDVGIVGAGFPSNRHLLAQVCSISTLIKRRHLLPDPTLILWDEAHHLAAKSWADIFAAYPNAVHIGLSATPERLDGTGLGSWFEEMVCGPTVRELIDMGSLCDYTLYAPTSVDLAGVHTVAGDFNKKELAAAMGKSTVTGDALSHYRKYCPGARGILFAWSIEASIEIARQFNEAGIPAAHVDGTTDDMVRDQAIRDFEAGKVRILSNVNLFSEGFDVPAVEAVFDLAPTQSLAMAMQRWGRALRPAAGKDRALLFDHAGNSARHGLPDADRVWTLEGRRKSASKGGDGPPVKQCPLCFATVAGQATVCRHCGYKFETQARAIEQVAGELGEVDREAFAAKRAANIEQARAQTLDDLIRVGTLRGMKNPEGWAKHVLAGRAKKEAGEKAAAEARAWAQGMVA
jgi:DNA repair protein RadD